MLKVCPQLRHAHDGLGHALGKHIEGDKLAYRQLIVHDQMCAVPQGGGVDKFANQVDGFMRPGGEVLRFKTGCHVGCQLVVPALGHAGLQRAGFNGLDARDGFYQHGLVFCGAGKLFVQPLAQQGDDGQADGHVQRQADEHD